jgi:carbon-monoxide dehydrogenase medium subunit
MQLNPFTFHAPSRLDEALQLHGQLENARLKAGGTFLLNHLKRMKKRGGRTPAHIISLSRIPELKKIRMTPHKLVIGPMVTMDEIQNADLSGSTRVLKDVAARVGNTPIRNMATIGGNLTCRYTWTELPAVMIALNAELYFQDAQGPEDVIPAEDFFAQGAKTKKLLTQIRIPVHPKGVSAYERSTRTVAQDVPILAVCISGTRREGMLQEPRVVINNGVSFAQRDTDIEAFLAEKEFKALGRTEAGAPATGIHWPGLDKPLYTARGNDYKQHMFRVCLRQCWEALKEQP